MSEALLWTGIGFFSGAIPYSLLIGFLAKVDIRQVGDGNPGASNVIRAAGIRWGILAILADVAKGTLPVALAHFAIDIRDERLIPVALAPVLGHAFSPFLRFKGGKAVAVTFGIWIGLTLGEAPILMGIFLLLMNFLFTVDGWAVILTLLALACHLLLNHNDAVRLAILGGNIAIVAWMHRRDLRRVPTIRSHVFRLIKRQL